MLKLNYYKSSSMQSALKYFLCALILGLSLAPMAWAQGDRPGTPDSIEVFVDRLVRAKSSQERSALLAATKQLVTPELRRELVLRGNNFLLAGRYATALDVYTFAESVAGQINDREGLASTSLNIGSVHYFQGNFDLALQRYQLARILFTSLGNQTEAAKALYGLGLIHKERHDNAAALKTFEQALNEFAAVKDDEEMANTLGNIGAVYYEQGDYAAASRAFLRSSELNPGSDNVLRIADAFYMQGDYEKAEEYYRKSLQGLVEEGNQAGIVGALEGAANSFYYQGNYDAALEYYQRNVVAQEALGSDAGVANSLQGIGNVYRGRGDFGSALENYFKSVTVAERSAVKAPTATTLGSIGLVRSMQGDNIQAREYYAKSLAQFEAAGDKVGMARMLAQLGNAHYTEGSFDAALEAYRKSFVLREAMNDKTGQANLLTGFGTVYLSQNNFTLALENYQKALTIFGSLGNKEGSAEALTKIAEANLLAGDFAQTVDLAERAASLAKEIESLNTFWYARLLSGKAHRALNQTDQASQAFAEAIATLESLRSQPASGEPSGRSSLLPYLAEIDLLIEQNRGAEAFDFAERAKLQALSAALGRNSVKINGSMSPSDQAEERKLTASLVSLDLQLERAAQARTADRLRPATLQDQRRKARLAYADFLNRMYTLNPRLKVDRGALSPLKLEDARELTADPQSALLEYAVTETNVYLFVMTRGQNSKIASGAGNLRTKPAESNVVLKVYPLNIKGSELVGRVAQLQQLLASRDEAFRQPARDLYDLLIKPAEAELGNKTRLVIVPDGILWRLPFEALQPAEDRYLIDRMSLSYAPSLSALREMRKRQERPARTSTSAVKSPRPATRTSTEALAAFGNPLLTKDLVKRLEVTYDGETVRPAPEREIEVEKLMAVYGDTHSRVYAGANAGEERAKLEATRSNVLHFAVRAILDDMSPMYASIALAPGESNQQEDGLLQSWEIINLQSQARLVVLSGSSTKRERAGEAVIVLQWSWFVAGTPSMLWSRWEVQSPGVTQLMTEFHARLKSQSKLKASYSKAEALRQSALTLRRSPAYFHPYYWSGFALLGDGR
jgi:tetratricopeptide (TPR) repeat protein